MEKVNEEPRDKTVEPKELEIVLKEITWLSGMTTGWGNGYVVIPKGHQLHGMHYDKIEENYDISVHGGLTFSDSVRNVSLSPEFKKLPADSWLIGFDTAHFSDNIDDWPKEAVQAEAARLRDQIQNLKYDN